ncbi:DNA/RNA non-specific endonuclease [Saccharomonospora cyanea]|uniref:DNA/RNA non-specific endonuclease n=1 Tax=Saccharomonospora cyanea NA-134 TaxID=882082 RepID=H5XLV8_9PSEU|nr:DNA/RNA non-specific endonuclease [Saccharomonospora cyanea]EHR62000.1 hypothetical protein SaccyDRAFT_3164 [Saccharomonospora cyanea NA-134]
MPEGNPLVAEAPQDGAGPGPLTSGNGDHGWATGIGVAESAIDAFNGIQEGNWIEGGLGVLGLAAEGAAAAIDPFGWLMSSVASFLMEHVQPLKDMLDSVCGDPPVIQSYSETWANVAKHLEETQVTFANAVKNGTTGWTGEAADAYRASCKEQEETIAGAATTAGAISTVVMIFGEVVAFVRETVRDLIADLVGKLISWVLETVCTLGFGTPVVVAQAVTAIAKWATKIADLLKKLTESIRRVSPLLGKLADVFGSIMKVCGKIMGKVTGLDVIDTKNIIDGGFVQRLGRGGDGPDLGGNGSGSGGSGSNGGSGSDGGSGSGGSDSDGGDGSGGDSGSGGDANPSGNSPRSDRTSGGNGGSQSDGAEGGSGDRGSDGGSSPGATSDGGGSAPDSSRPGSDRGGDDSTSESPRGNTGDSGSPATSPGSPGGRGGDGGSPSTLRSDTPNTVGANDSANAGGRPTSDYQSTSTTQNPYSSQPSPDTSGPAASPAASHPTPSHPTSSTPSPDTSAPNSPSGDRPAPSTPGHSTPSSPGGSDPGAPPRADSPSSSPHNSPGSPNAPHTPSHQSPGPAHADPGGPRPSGAHHTDSTTTSGLATSPSSPSSTPAAPRTDGFSPTPQRGPDAGPSTQNSPQPMAGGPAHHGSPGGNSPSSAPGGRGGSPRDWTGTPGSPGARPHADVPPTRPGPDGPPHRPPTRPQGHHPQPGPHRPGPAPETHVRGPRPTPSAHAPTPPHAPRGFTSQPGPANPPHVQPDGRPFGPSPDAGPGPHTHPPAHGPGPQQPHAPRGPHAPRPNQPGANPPGRPDAGVPPQRPSHGLAPDRSSGDSGQPPYRRPDHDGRDGGPRDHDSRPDDHDPRHGDRHDRNPDNRDPHDRDGDRSEKPDDRDPHGNDDRPTPEQVNQRHAERTPAGTSFHRGDPEMGDLPHRVKPDPDGRYTVDVHVTPEGKARIGNREYSPEEFAEILRRNGDYGDVAGRPIRLIGCDASSNDFAQRLSRELDTEVLAPNKPAWTDSNGNVFSSDYEIGPDGKPRPKIPPNGEWSTHSPDGSTTRASDDGFTPDTADAHKGDVSTDTSRARGSGDGPPDPDAPNRRPSPDQPADPDSDHPNRNPKSRVQEAQLRDPEYSRRRRETPQAVRDFEPPTNNRPDRIAHGEANGIRPPRRDESFPGDRQLEANTSYEVRNDDGTLRGTYHTDDRGRVTHIDTSVDNVPPRNRDGSPNDDYKPNPDVAHPPPNTTLRVEIEGQHQVFHTDADGMPEPAVTFERPDYPDENRVAIPPGPPKPPRPGQPFVTRKDLEPHREYEVHDSQGVYRGRFYTDGEGRVRWADVDSGRLMRTNPDFAGLHRLAEDASVRNPEVRLRQRFDPDSPPSDVNLPDHERDLFDNAVREDVTLSQKESFFDGRTLEPNRQYVVHSDYEDRDGTVTKVRAVYWTDSNGQIAVAETYQPHHPDLNKPAPRVVYNVDGGRYVYETGPEVTPTHGVRSYRTDTVAGSTHDVEVVKKDDLVRQDETAQKTAGGIDGKEKWIKADGTDTGRMRNKYDGGHMYANQLSGPGELINMVAQWRVQNAQLDLDGMHWRSFEDDLIRFLQRDDTSIERMEVFALRDGSRVPHELQVRWIEEVGGVRTVRIRSFPNDPASAQSVP